MLAKNLASKCQVLSAAGIEIVTGASGTVKEAIERYKKNELKEINNPTVDVRFGICSGRGRR